MKKLIFIAAALIAASCTTSSNRGYGYNSKTTAPAPQQETQKKESLIERAERTRMATTMKLYGTDGKYRTTLTAYKGEFDGHTWYVFFDNVAVPAVIHDPNCKCLQKDN